MSGPAPAALSFADWAARGRPIAGERESGDRHVAAITASGGLFALIDGLGHGPEAATAARRAVAELERDPQRPVLSLITACHEALRGTRGAVMSLAAIDAARGSLSWAGVGNVEAVVVRGDPVRSPARERVLLRSGVVGYQLPPLRANELALFAGDVLIMASDGLRHDFADAPPVGLSAEACADYLLRTFARPTDDALVLVARYQGASA